MNKNLKFWLLGTALIIAGAIIATNGIIYILQMAVGYTFRELSLIVVGTICFIIGLLLFFIPEKINKDK